ncbi:MAG: hypothetical protein ACOCRK_02025 [bacterium]
MLKPSDIIEHIKEQTRKNSREMFLKELKEFQYNYYEILDRLTDVGNALIDGKTPNDNSYCYFMGFIEVYTEFIYVLNKYDLEKYGDIDEKKIRNNLEIVYDKYKDLIAKWKKSYEEKNNTKFKILDSTYEFIDPIEEYRNEEGIYGKPLVGKKHKQKQFEKIDKMFQNDQNILIKESYDFSNTDEMKRKVSGLVPIYIIFNNSSHIISKIITKFTKGDFSHASLSLTGMDQIISFGDGKKNNGIQVENIYEFYSNRKPDRIKIISFFVTEYDYEKIYEILTRFRKQFKKYRYSYRGLILFPFLPSVPPHHSLWNKKEFFCSQFLSWCLGNITKAITNINISPNDLNRIIDESEVMNTLVLFDGKVEDFDEELIYKFEDALGIDKEKTNIKVKRRVESKKEINITNFFKESDNDIISELLGALCDYVYDEIDTDDEEKFTYINKLNMIINSY